MLLIKYLASISLAAITMSPLYSESRCPGNIASLPFHLAQRSLIIVPVFINHFGPYDFLVDTGTGLTTLDPMLAAELHLKTRGSLGIDGVGFSGNASFAYLDLLQAGSHPVANHPVIMHDLQPLQASGLHFRGILGGDFLGHFDVLIDYARSMLCLDDTKTMLAALKGKHIPLATPFQAPSEAVLATLLIVPVRLSGFGARQLQLALDSGTNASFLFHHAVNFAPGLRDTKQLDAYGGDGVKREFSQLPPQSMQIGSLRMQQVSFAVPSDFSENALTSREDGLLTLVLFRRVFISYADRFVVLDPW
jgi:hypothetical protein